MDPITIRRIEVKKINPDFNEYQQVITYVLDEAPLVAYVGVPEPSLAEDTQNVITDWATSENFDLG